MLLSARRPGRLPIVPTPETDELLSSWLTRTAAIYGTTSRALLEQLGAAETNSAIFDWAASFDDLRRVADALGTDRTDVIRRSFVGMPQAGLTFVSMSRTVRACAECDVNFFDRGLDKVVLRSWRVAVALQCGRCGGALVSVPDGRRKLLRNVAYSHEFTEARDEVFGVILMTMYDLTQAPVV